MLRHITTFKDTAHAFQCTLFPPRRVMWICQAFGNIIAAGLADEGVKIELLGEYKVTSSSIL